jgi:hypothetical protein
MGVSSPVWKVPGSSSQVNRQLGSTVYSTPERPQRVVSGWGVESC